MTRHEVAKLGRLATAVLGVAFLLAVVAFDHLDWRPINGDDLAAHRVGSVGGGNPTPVAQGLCCVKSTRASCKDQTPFQCRFSPACTAGQAITGSCTTDASCRTRDNMVCGTINPPSPRTVDQCTVTGATSNQGCTYPDEKCVYNNYIPITDPNAPQANPQPLLCDSNGQYCGDAFQPSSTCD